MTTATRAPNDHHHDGKQTESGIALMARWARTWGNDPLLVQGPGGNMSLKDGDRLTVKASGSRMSDATGDYADAGHFSGTSHLTPTWTEISINACLTGLPMPRETMPRPQDELAYSAAISNARLDSSAPSPSIEAGMHAIIRDRFVVHLHSIVAQVIAALPAGSSLVSAVLASARDAGFDVVVVPPSVPGTHLTWAVAGRSRHARAGLVILLKGHGIVWTGDDPALLEQTITKFESTGRELLAIPALLPKQVPDENRLRLDLSAFGGSSWADHALFPDFAVFFPPEIGRHRLDTSNVDLGPLASDGENRNRLEIGFAHALISVMFARFMVPNPLPRAIAEASRKLDLEKRRLKIATKGIRR